MRTLGQRIYWVLLFAYPKEFRRDYGAQMVQLLRDCERDAKTLSAVSQLWARTLLDVIHTVPNEHIANLRKESHVMNKLRTDLAAVFGCLLLIVVAFLLLSYGRSHAITPILKFGFALDAIVVTGVVGNLIVFSLLKLTSMRPVKIALWSFLLVTIVLGIASTAIAAKVDPAFNAANVLIGYVVSFFFWFGLHWVWSQKLRPTETA